MKRIFKTKAFERWLKKSTLNNDSLCAAIHEMEKGLFEADLGAGLYKKRVAGSGQGKRSGSRTLIASNLNSRWFFVFGFAKSQRANINQRETEALKKLTHDLLELTEPQIKHALANHLLLEICHDQ